MRLCARTGEAVPVSPMLFEAVRFALAVADETGGAFDPTVGGAMVARGFDREHRSGVRAPAPCVDPGASYRDVRVDAGESTITLARPLVARSRRASPKASPSTWRRASSSPSATSRSTPAAICCCAAGTIAASRGRSASGIRAWTASSSKRSACPALPSARRGTTSVTDHLADPRSGATARQAASVTVVAPNAMLADALATAAFVLGPATGSPCSSAKASRGSSTPATSSDSRRQVFRVARGSVARFFRTPKGLLTIVLVALIAIAAPHEGWRLVLPELVTAVTVAGAIDAAILRYRHRRWEFPGGAVLTALIVGMVLSAQVAVVRRDGDGGDRRAQQVRRAHQGG